MNSAWTEFLTAQGASVAVNAVPSFPQLLAEQHQHALTGNVIADLSTFAVVTVTGTEAEKFLQGQFTNDLKPLNPSKAQRSAWCSAKGRVLSSFYVLKIDNTTFHLILPQDAVEAMLKRLRMFVLRADVKFTLNEDIAIVGLMGTNSADYLQQLTQTDVAQHALSCSNAHGLQILCTHQQVLRYLVYGTMAEVQNLWKHAIAQQFMPSASSAWELLDILSGVPQVTPALSDEFVPQMLNWEILEGMSFKKGCYAGQEIIARTQYLGALKRRLFLVKLASGELPAVGENITVPEETQSVGKLVNVQLHPAGYAVGLAVLQLSHAETKNLQLANGVAVECLALPYEVVTQ